MRLRNYIEFLVKWRKPHRSSSTHSEIISKMRLLPHGEKVAFRTPSFSTITRQRQTSCKVSWFDMELELESQRQTVCLVLKPSGIKSIWITMVLYEEGAMAISRLKLELMALKLWENIKPFYLQFRYESIPRHMKAVVDANRGHTKY